MISGIYDYIKKKHKNSQLFGFLGGPAGIYNGKYVELRDDTVNYFRNRGGFDIIRNYSLQNICLQSCNILQIPAEIRLIPLSSF